MSNVIQFLESLGSRPAPSPAEYAATVAALDVAPAARKALTERDHAALNDLLDGRATMFCFVAMPDESEQEAIPDEPDGEPLPDAGEPTPEGQ